MAAEHESACGSLDVGFELENANKGSLLSIMTLLQKTQCDNKKIDLLKITSTDLHNSNPELTRKSLRTTILSPLFVEVVQLAVPAEFRDRGHYLYENEDFAVLCERTEVVLKFLHAVLDECCKCGAGDVRSVDECLPSLLVVLTTNLRTSLWFKDSVHKLALLILNQLRILYKVDSLSELLFLDVKHKTREVATPNSCLLGQYLQTVRCRLSKENWQANPTFVESFYWMLTQMIKFPHLSNCLEMVLPPVLNFVDSHVTEQKVMGIQCLHHITTNVTSDSFRWYGRAEVVYAALKQQIYSSEPDVVRALHPALLTILPIVDHNPAQPASPTSPKQADGVLSIILAKALTENGLVLRRLYTQCVADFVDYLGIYAARHLSRLIALVSGYLEAFDGPEEQARFNALKILASLLRNVWPRMPCHAAAITKSLLRLIQDVVHDCSATPDNVKDRLKQETLLCLSLLLEVCPRVAMCLQLVCDREELADVALIVKDLLD